MRPLDYYINATKNKFYVKNKDYIDCISDPYTFLVGLYEDKLNVKGERTEKRLEIIEAFFIDAFNDKDYDPNDANDSRVLTEIRRVFKYLFDKYKNRESAILFDSLFYKYRNDIPCLFDQNIMDMLNGWDEEQLAKVELFYDELMRGKELDSFESDLLYTYLKNHLDDEQHIMNMCNDCFQLLVEQEKKLNRTELAFVMEYMTYHDWDLKSERPHVYINNFKNNSKFGESAADTNSIFISSYFIGEPIIDHEVIFDYHEENYHTLSKTLYHEIQHQRQGEFTRRKFKNLTTFQFVCRRLIPKKFGKKFDEYKENYMYKEIETDANIIGAHKSYLLAKEFDLDSKDYHYEAFIDYCKKFSKSVQVDEFGIASDVINFNVNNLREIVGKDPKIIKQYPVLETLFTNSGELKTLKQLISEYNDVLQDEPNNGEKRLYNYLFKYYLYNSKELGIDLFDIEFDSLNDKLTYLIMLEDYIINEHKALQNIFDTINSYDLKNEEDLKSILYDKTGKLVEAYGIIKKNKILDFVNIVMNSSNKSLNISVKVKKLLRVYLEMRNSNLAEHVKNNSLISNDPEMYSIANRIDALDNSLNRLDKRRKIIKSRNKQPDYIGQIKR